MTQRSLRILAALGILGLTLTVTAGLAQASIGDVGGVLITLGALGLALSKKVPVILILALGAAAGLIFYR